MGKLLVVVGNLLFITGKSNVLAKQSLLKMLQGNR